MTVKKMMTIPEFFEGRDIFITGGTGFMGEVLIEKLLRSCPKLNKIFILMRSKKGKTVEERVEDVKKIQLFDVLRQSNPKVLNKIIGVEGDVKEKNLGFTEESFKTLENVSVIFHLAASVRFDDPLKDAVLLNTRGTHELIKIALKLKHIDAFVHVSTTYCNPDHIYIEEKLYPPHGNWKKVIKMAETYDQETLDILMPKLTDEMPNTYTYTKGLAEQICDYYKHQLPIVIFRPSIVVGTEREPVVGWCNNFNGPVGLLVACGYGILRTMYASGEEMLDCITADVVIKGIIVSSWVCGMKLPLQPNNKEMFIYNCSSLHKVNLNFLIQDGKEIVKHLPFKEQLWVADGRVTKCKFMNYLRLVLFQLLPALIVDHVVCRMRKQKPFLMKIQRRITHAILALRVFVLKEWHITNSNFLALNGVLLPDDRSPFCMKRSIESNEELFTALIIGARKYLFLEDSEELPKYKARYRRMLILDKTLKLLFTIAVVYLVYSKMMKIIQQSEMFSNFIQN